jgi:hypothetical protein
VFGSFSPPFPGSLDPPLFAISNGEPGDSGFLLLPIHHCHDLLFTVFLNRDQP